MYLLKNLKTFNRPESMMVHFYTAIIESIKSCSIIWYSTFIAKDKSRLYHTLCSTEKLIGPSLQRPRDLQDSRTLNCGEDCG